MTRSRPITNRFLGLSSRALLSRDLRHKVAETRVTVVRSGPVLLFKSRCPALLTLPPFHLISLNDVCLIMNNNHT